MPHNRLEGPPRHLLADLLTPVEASDHLAVHLINRAAADGVVGVVFEEVLPGAADVLGQGEGERGRHGDCLPVPLSPCREFGEYSERFSPFLQ